MWTRGLAWIGLAALLGGCAAGDGPWWAMPREPSAAAGADPAASGEQAARAIWGVVPTAPKRKADLHAGLITGSAVAVSADALLTHCLATDGRTRVGLVRHNKYRIARVWPDAPGGLCRLTVAEGPLNPPLGYRSFADLRVGEPVVALASRTSAEVAAAPGWLAGKGAADDPFLEVTSAVPAGSRSAVVVDGFGNLIGLGAAAQVADGLVLAVPVGPPVVASLANRNLGDAGVLLAALTPDPQAQPRRPPILLPAGDDDRPGGDRSIATRPATPTTGARDQPAAPSNRPSPGTGQGAGPGGTAPTDGSGGAVTGSPSVDGGSGGGVASGADPPAGGSADAPGVGPGGTPGPGGATGGGGREPDREVARNDEPERGRGRGRGRGRDGDDDASPDRRGPGDGGRGRGRGRGGDNDRDDRGDRDDD